MTGKEKCDNCGKEVYKHDLAMVEGSDLCDDCYKAPMDDLREYHDNIANRIANRFEPKDFFQYVFDRKHVVAKTINKVEPFGMAGVSYPVEGKEPYLSMSVICLTEKTEKFISIDYKLGGSYLEEDLIEEDSITVRAEFETGKITFEYAVDGKTNSELFDDVLEALVVLSRGDL